MKLFNKLAIVAVGLVLGCSAIPGQASAASLEMVTNGEFEQTSGGGIFKNSVHGWETTNSTRNGKFEVWNQGKIGSPAIGSDGLGTGKHLELNVDNPNDTISQTFTLAENIKTNALFSFDAWIRRGGEGNVSVTGSESGSLLNTAMLLNGSSWTENMFNLSVIAGETITVAFQGDNNTNSAKTPHIDQVSFAVESVPEPTSILGLLAVGAFGSVSSLKSKRKQEA